jgi:hypothetical protein
VELRCLAVGSVVAASGLAEARIGAAHRPEEADSAVVGAREETKEEAGTIGLPAAAARSTVAGLVVVGLSRVSYEVRTARKHVEIPYPPFSGGAISSQISYAFSS